jgi:hypothetical protein
MATFEAQVEGLTSLSIDGSSSPTQTELTQFLTDGAKEILTALPMDKKMMYSTSSALDNSTTYLTLGGSEVLGVMRDDGTINQPCRRIPSTLSGRAQDSAEMIYGTTSDPVWWIVNNILSVYPEPSSAGATVQILAYPAVAYGDSAITKFPDEAEYLVPLYASVKTLQNKMASMMDEIPRNSDQDGTFTTASASSQGYEKVRYMLENSEDIELAAGVLGSLTNEMQQFMAEYKWYQEQQAKLQADYDKGLQIVRAG